jgi:pimeloyl-ACP methyl ester carboxylesterase
MAAPAYSEGEWESEDGLTLHYRDYPADAGTPERPPLLCLHGLTRNARDFEALAEAFAGKWRMIVPEMRGRGQSEYARDAASYRLDVYVADLLGLLRQLDCGAVVAIGTSMGGLMAVTLAATKAWPLAGIVLNDIGPEIEPPGMARIRDYVGQGGSFETWMHAARALRDMAGAAHPQFRISEWLGFAKRAMVVGGNGRIVFDYDMKIAEPLNAVQDGPPADLWPAFRALDGMPSLVLRGELSDLLSAVTVARMQSEVPGLRAATVPRVGHAPTLAEPEAQRAIAALLAEVA